MENCLERARAGDAAATEVVVASLRPRLARMAAYYARCTGEDAEDLLQEAWIGLLEALPELDVRIGIPEQYLIQRARWRLLDAVKRSRAQCAPERSAPLEEADMADCHAPPVPEVAVGAACVTEFARQLKSTQRAVLDCLLAGLTWREAGRALGFTSANVAYHVRQIRRRYEGWCGE